MHSHDKGRLTSFARAFRTYSASEHNCKCGVLYRSRYSSDSEDDADDADDADSSASWVDDDIVVIAFENAHYADCCTCWYPRAMRIMDWLECYGEEIVKFFQSEIERKTRVLYESVDPKKLHKISEVPEGLERLLRQASIRNIDPSDLAPS